MIKKLVRNDYRLQHFVNQEQKEGYCSNLSGDCSGLRGDLESCKITKEERKKRIDIAELVVSKL